MLEKTVETYLVDRVRAAGGDAYKFTSPARVSVPDRIVVFPPARIYFVELKRPGGKLTRGQEREHARLRALGCDVRTLDSREAVDAFVREVGVPPAPYLHVYEYPSPFGGTHREFSPTTWNGQQPARTVALYVTPQPAAAPIEHVFGEMPAVREFQEWLDARRDCDVSSVFHEIVAKFRAVVEQPAAAPMISADERAAFVRHQGYERPEIEGAAQEAWDYHRKTWLAALAARAPSTDRESVIAAILCKLDGLIKKGPLDGAANAERNGLVLAFNVVAQLSVEQPAAAPTNERAAQQQRGRYAYRDTGSLETGDAA
ncbi:hypothetical protein [Burkholderia cenocepacia]|uniref:hypothetical protein n=1 Tax=Burkholderia cenocepacia TaxID=95486 RepID=UPI0024B7846B|nr:hypothetical protein [Burkholderia cenocepacia]MDI9684283.1 hypothetical protein [Burkholderia cenocepacia]